MQKQPFLQKQKELTEKECRKLIATAMVVGKEQLAFDKATARLKYFKITHDNFNAFILNNNGSCNTASDIIKFLSVMIENPVVLYYGNLNCMVSTNSDNSKLILSDEIQPYEINTHRLLVRGHRIPYEEATEQEPDVDVKPELSFTAKVLIVTIIVIFIGLILTVIYSIRDRKRRKIR